MLEVKPMCVCEITSVLNLAPSTVSKHLSLLQDAGLIEDTKDGRWVNYALSTLDRSPLVGDILGLLGGTLDADPGVVEDRKKAKKADRVKICR